MHAVHGELDRLPTRKGAGAESRGGLPGPGAIDQLADHLILSQEVRGSSPRSSTSVRS